MRPRHCKRVKMNFETGLVFSALLLFLKTSSVYCHLHVDCVSQPFISSQICPSGPALLQAAPQLVVPSIIKPTVHPLDNYIDVAPIVPNCGGLPGLIPGILPIPPIIIDRSDNNDDWHNMLYLLILAMKNRNDGGWDNGCCNCGNGCNCGGCCNCCGGSSSGGFNCGNNGCITYVPYPIPVPVPTGSYFGSVDNSGGGACDDGAPNEINLIIKTDANC